MKPKYNYTIEQNTDEWFEIKLGKFSASSGAELLMPRTTKGYQKLIRRITEERITGERSEGGFAGNWTTERGHELEPVAIKNYEKESFNKVKRVGVVIKSDWCLCSPDGLIDKDGLIQIKCPIFTTQWDYIEKPKVPTNYYKQMQFELMVTGREYNIFYAWHPSLKPVEIKVERDEEMIKSIELRLEEAIKEVELNINKLKQ